MKVLLIASNPDAVIPSVGFDLYIHFTSCPHWGKTPWCQSIVVVRKWQGVVDAKSFRYHEPSKQAKDIIAAGWHDDVRSIDKKIELIDLSETPYPKGKSPTSGMAATYHYLNRGHEVTWCGFDLSKAPRFDKGGVHAWLHERQMQLDLVESGRVTLI